MRVVFLGTPEFAGPALRALVEASGLEVVAVVTQPDRKAGRGQKFTSPPVKQMALRAGLPLFQPPRLGNNPEAPAFLEEYKPDLMVVVAFGQILPPGFFDFPPLGTLNIHASLLPRYRGAAPVAHAILEGQRTTGVTIMKIDEGMDTGDILTQQTVPIGENTTAGELARELSLKGADLLVRTIPDYARATIMPRAQDHSQASYAPRLAKEQALIDWSRPADSIHNQIRGLNPWPVAVTHFRSQPVKVWRSLRSQASAGEASGLITSIEEQGIVVSCGDGKTITLSELQLPGKACLSAQDFANGLRLRPGELFGVRS
ncbi:MAG: methionyl-tRNA formyltransferase [Acidobacteriota bacterium]